MTVQFNEHVYYFCKTIIKVSSKSRIQLSRQILVSSLWGDVRKIDFYTLRNLGSILNRILELDTRVSPTDREILAGAIEDNAVNLVTLDKDLIGNKRIEREFGIKIKPPKELL